MKPMKPRRFDHIDVRNIRNNLGLKAYEIAEVLGVCKGHVSRMQSPAGQDHHRPVTEMPRRLLILLWAWKKHFGELPDFDTLEQRMFEDVERG